MAALGSVINMYQTLIKEWNHRPVNLDNVGKLLTKMKLALTELQFIPTSGSSPSPQELVVASKNVITKQIYKSGVLPESPYLYQLLGLNLLCLLAQNRLAEFHTELELLPAEKLQENIYIKCPVDLEQYLMEGNYNKVFLSKGNIPAESYQFFINMLLDTLRDEVANCIEKSYNKISQKEACRMLFFEQEKMLINYANKKNWQIDSTNHYTFQQKVHSQQEIPSLKVIKQCLGYAKELERIV